MTSRRRAGCLSWTVRRKSNSSLIRARTFVCTHVHEYMDGPRNLRTRCMPPTVHPSARMAYVRSISTLVYAVLSRGNSSSPTSQNLLSVPIFYHRLAYWWICDIDDYLTCLRRCLPWERPSPGTSNQSGRSSEAHRTIISWRNSRTSHGQQHHRRR